LGFVEHYDGTAWRIQDTPHPCAFGDRLLGISVSSATSIWAVGICSTSTGDETLIEHYDGASWTRQPSPPGDVLSAVNAESSTDVWAVGASADHTLVEHFDGSKWQVISAPAPRDESALYGVKATGPSNAWAVGVSATFAGTWRTLILHWNGSIWKVQKSPDRGQYANYLLAIGADAPTDAFAVGTAFTDNVQIGSKSLVMHCC
jgi:hypothetical protein